MLLLSKDPQGKEQHNQPKLFLQLLENARKLEYNQTVLANPKLGDTWNDRMKDLVTGLVGLINVEGIPVGKFISVLIGFFWPSSGVDIWELVKDQVEYMIDQKILAAEVNQMSNSLDGLHRTMKQYVEAKNNEKGALMGAIVAVCNDLHSRLVHSNNAVHLIPLTVTLSYMHLANLKERLMHGKEIYDEDNTAVWKKNLKEEIELYKKEFQELYAKWQKWRSDSITVKLDEYKSPTTIPPFFFYVFTGDVDDKVTGENRNFYTMQSTVVSHPTYFKEICDTVKTMLWNRANGAILQTLVPTFFLDNFMPGSEDIPSKPHPSMLKAGFGPFSYNILEGNSDRSRTVLYPSSDNPKETPVTQAQVREWNQIDGLRFIYENYWGRFVGNPNGGLQHDIDMKGALVHNIKISFNNGGVVDIEIIRSDGISSGRLGNRGGWSVTRVEAGDIDTFGMYNVKMTGNNGVTQIEMFYRHFPCRPSDIKLYMK